MMTKRQMQVIAAVLTVSLCALLWWVLAGVPPAPLPATATPTSTPEPTATVTQSLEATATPSLTPTRTATPRPTETPTPTATPTPAWRPVVVLRHDAFERVMARFPERYNPDAQALIALVDCTQIGRWYWLRSGGYVLRALVSDCQNDEHAAAHAALWGDQETIELEGIVWYGLRLDALPSPVVEIAPVP